MDEVYKQIIKQYDSLVLTPKLGNCQIRDELIAGLEKVLGSTKPIEKVPEEDSFLDRPIDYKAMKQEYFSKGYSRRQLISAYNTLANIEASAHKTSMTYRQLLKLYEDAKSSIYVDSFISFLRRQRNCGPRGAKILGDYFSKVDNRFK